MSLIDDLRAVADHVPPSAIPTLNEIAKVLGALILHLEHPQDFLKAAEDGGHDAIAELIQPPESEQDAPQTEPASPTPASSPSELEQENASLRAQLAAAQGAQQRTTVETTPPDDDTEGTD